MTVARLADIIAPIFAGIASRQRVPEDHDHIDCPYCEGDGRLWNNCDPTSGQWTQCCEENR